MGGNVPSFDRCETESGSYYICLFLSAQDVDIKWVEYQNMIKYLSQWIKHNVAIMSDRSFPNNPVEIKVWSQDKSSNF